MKQNLETIFNVVIGTAGHIDHGKSSLVERLSGIDPDRLPEEKARGLTIDLGFAPLTLRNGLRVGVIDVPGHERLIKNMVAGATGIDLVLLVVAADDGVMPQTREHLNIMRFLGLRHGLIAITKIDLVDEEFRELVRADIEDAVEGTFLEGAPMIEVSSTTGEGIETLKDELERLLVALEPRDASGVFRMPIQRVFSSKGFGTVVTGVPISGQTRAGATLEIVPLGKTGRVRGIQAYMESTDLARAGHSSALNLSDVDYREVHRGMVATEPGYFRGASMLEARFLYLPLVRRPLLHQARVRIHAGTAEVIGRVHLLERKTMEPGEESFVQFRLEEQLVAAPGDRFVVRSFSPPVTLGGGEILDRSRWRLKVGKDYVLHELAEKAEVIGDPRRFIEAAIYGLGLDATTEKELSQRAGMPVDDAKTTIRALEAEGKIVRGPRGGLVVSARRMAEAREATLRFAESYFAENPRRRFLDKLELRQRLAANDAFFQTMIQQLESDGVLAENLGGKLSFRDFGPRLSEEEERVRERLLERLARAPFTPPAPAEVAAEEGWDERSTEELAELLGEEGAVVKLGGGLYFHRQALEDAQARIRAFLEEHGAMTASQAREVLETTRKFCIPLLEHLDRTGFTLRQGDVRKLRK